jgi:hypothetical protein
LTEFSLVPVESFNLDLQTKQRFLAQILNVVRCYPPQPKGGEFPECELAEVPEESTSIAPTTSHASRKRKNAIKLDRVENLEDLDGHNFSSDEDNDAVIPRSLLPVVLLLDPRKMSFRILALKPHKLTL